MLRVFAAAALAVMTPAAGSAATYESWSGCFTSGEEYDTCYTADGFVYDHDIAYRSAWLTLHDEGDLARQSRFRAVDGGRFDAGGVVFDHGHLFARRITEMWGEDETVVWDNLRISGYRSNAVVESLSLSVAGPGEVALSAAFRDIDLLVLMLLPPPGLVLPHGQPPETPGAVWCPPFYCTHVGIADILREKHAVAPIPLPPAALLLVGGLALLGGLRGGLRGKLRGGAARRGRQVSRKALAK